MEAETQLPTKVYRLRPFMKARLISMFLLYAFAVVVFVFITIDTIQNPAPGKIFALLGGMGIIAFFMYGTVPIRNTRLELSHEGITLYNPAFYNIYTSWQNIAGIENVRYPYSLRSIQSLILREPAKRNICISKGKKQRIAVIERASLLATNRDLINQSIPLGLLSKDDLEKGEFHAYLQHYAPHLLAH